MENYAGNGVYAPIVRVPENDDEPSFTIFRAGLVDLADRTSSLSLGSEAETVRTSLIDALDLSYGVSVALVLKSQCAIDSGWIFAVAAGNDKIAWSLTDGREYTDISANIGAPQTIALECCASNYESGAPATALVAAGNSAKIYLSTDQGATWAFNTAPGTPTAIDAIVWDAENALFIAIGKTAAAPYIATSPDGATWTSRTVPASITGSQNGVSIAQLTSGVSPGRLVASWTAQTKVAHSDDGVDWTASSSTLNSGKYIVRSSGGTLVALDANATTNGYASTDGDTWNSGSVVRPGSSATIGVKAFSALGGVNGVGDVFAAFTSPPSGGALFVSQDYGASWRYILHKGLGAMSTLVEIQGLQYRFRSLFTDSTNSIAVQSARRGL